jgi:predicted nucleotidyltransferase
MRNNPSVERINEDKEMNFIQDCLRVYLFQEDTITPPACSLDWDRFYQLLIQERLTGLFSILGRSYPDVWPRAVKVQLREERYRQLLYYDWCSRQAEAVLRSLRDLSIPVIVLKGWAVVQIVYGGDYSQRPSSDIDLLVKPCDTGRVTDLLRELEYSDFALEPWPGYFQRYINSSHFVSAHTYRDTNLSFNVDLHWGFPDAPYYDRRIAVEGLFERSQSIRIAGIECSSLATEDLLIYGSVHMAHHGYTETLSRIYEIAALILRAGPRLNWEMVMNSASTWRVTIPLRRMLTEIRSIWPGVIPVGVVEDVRKLKSSWGERLIDWGLSKSTNKEAASILLSVLNTRGLWWRLRFFLETAFPGETYLRHYFGPAPGNLWLLLYFRRFYQFLGG